ncbi:WD40/YVTN/BNR-like repeat-containing protein [Histidinibacterium aquaticum]|uniref:Exo-alpha-sialidase n=1 Tax=Histidinibacterium aquaticum TaxID=2613962 RepID=A0A5J5GEF5_9RHOB|nr:exo-alpha-sialidase [Histidinibacterium aquaticum]KAA9006162.1 exo-alpha-sialidase [Histidinibacterium aquaticum]
MARVDLLLGTSKGAFIIEGDEDRENWTIRGPFCDAWPINHMTYDPESGAIYAAGGFGAFLGVDVWKTEDHGESWTRSGEGLAYDDDTAIDQVWSLGAGHGAIYAGVKPAGLFRSTDHGQTWSHVRGLSEHPTRPDWPPGGAGLTLHHILTDPESADRLWVGISSAGTFYSEDGGETWSTRNKGVKVLDWDTGEYTYPEFGNCVHGLSLGPSGTMYQQGHNGMFVSRDHGAEWTAIDDGLPSTFGFPVVAHPRAPDTAWFFPMNGDIKGRHCPDGKAAVWRTRDGGQTWEDLREGLPQEHCYFTVLRQAMATDGLEDIGLYFGTNSGSLYASRDGGDRWSCVARDLPLIYSVEAMRVA